MKILHIESGRHLYGGPLQVFFLIRGLNDRGVKNVLACARGAEIGKACAEYASTVIEMPMKGDWDARVFFHLIRVVKKERPDIVYLHSRRGTDYWGALAAHWCGVPVVLCRRVDNPESRLVVRWKHRLYNHIVAISKGIQAVLEREGVPLEKITCVRSVVDAGRYRPGHCDIAWFRNEFKLDADEKTLAVVAQFIRRKGHATLLDALPAILKKQPRTRVLFFGKGAEEAALREHVRRLNLESHVIFAGFRNDLARVMPCVDIVVHPAFMEGLGVALLQAAACGVPIVACRVGGIPEVVLPGVNGELIEPDDAGALAAAVTGLLESDERRLEYGRAGRRLVEENFSLDTMTAGTLAVFEKVLAAARKGGTEEGRSRT